MPMKSPNVFFLEEELIDPFICTSFLHLAPSRWLRLCYSETKMFIFITVSIRFSEVNESSLAADNSVLQLLIAISSLKFLFTVSSKDRKIHAKKETMKQNKNEPSRKKTLLEKD